MPEVTTPTGLFDRNDLRTLETIPSLDDLIEQGVVAGVFFVKDSELLTGFQRQMYMSGLVALEVGADGTPKRAFQLVTPVVEEPVVEEPVSEEPVA